MSSNKIELVPVESHNWRNVAGLKVRDDQSDFVTSGSYYLCLCHYGKLWNPLAVKYGESTVGFLMWAYDKEEKSCWLGGILIDKDYQGKGFGEVSVREAITLLSDSRGYKDFALSYNPTNTRAKFIYEKIGFKETGETEDDEVVARLSSTDMLA